MRVRGFLRRFERGFFMHSAAESFMQLKSKQAAEFINDMVALELIEPTKPFGDKAAFQVATRGHPSPMGISEPGNTPKQPSHADFPCVRKSPFTQ